MAIVNKEQDIKEKKAEDKKVEDTEKQDQIRYRIRPTRYINYDVATKTWEMEFHLPGVPKNQVKFKILKDAYSLEATRDQAVYASSEYIPFDVDVDSVKAEYDNGLLYVSGKIKDPLAEAVEIKLS